MSSLVNDLVPSDSPPATPVPLPRADLRARGASKWRRDVEESFVAFLFPSVICTVIWIAVSRTGFFWPVFPMLFLGLNLIKTIAQRESVIDREIRRLEKKEAKDALSKPVADRDHPDEIGEG